MMQILYKSMLACGTACSKTSLCAHKTLRRHLNIIIVQIRSFLEKMNTLMTKQRTAFGLH